MQRLWIIPASNHLLVLTLVESGTLLLFRVRNKNTWILRCIVNLWHLTIPICLMSRAAKTSNIETSKFTTQLKLDMEKYLTNAICQGKVVSILITKIYNSLAVVVIQSLKIRDTTQHFKNTKIRRDLYNLMIQILWIFRLFKNQEHLFSEIIKIKATHKYRT